MADQQIEDLTTEVQKVTLSPSSEHQNATLSPVTHECAACYTLAKLSCTGCDTTLLPAKDNREKTWNCGKDCQAKDWPAHKIGCKEIKAKVDIQLLKRATVILRSLFNVHRHVVYDLSITSAERKGDILHVTEGEYDVVNNLLPGFEHVYSIKNLETSLVKTIKEIALIPKFGSRGWIFERSRAHKDRYDEFPHRIFQVTLKDGTKWAMDLTAAQYGYKDNLVPWDKYVEERVIRVTGIEPFGVCLRNWRHDFAPSDNEGMMTIRGRDALGRVLHCARYSISKTMVPAIISTFEHQDLSTQRLLHLPLSEFEEALENIISTALEVTENHKQHVMEQFKHENNKIALNTTDSESIQEDHQWTMSVDINGVSHYL